MYFARLEQFIRFFEDFESVQPDAVAVAHFERLRREGVRIGASVLKIASITISRGALLLTRNTRTLNECRDCDSRTGRSDVQAGGSHRRSQMEYRRIRIKELK